MLLKIYTVPIAYRFFFLFGRPNFKKISLVVNIFNTLLQFHSDLPLKLLPNLILGS